MCHPLTGDHIALFLAYQAGICCLPRSSGIFARIDGTDELVADNTFTIPDASPLTFGSFNSDPDISGNNVAFHSGYGAHTGIYLYVDGNLTKVVDVNDTEPGGDDKFTTFSIPVISERQVAFRGVGGTGGIYTGDGGLLSVIVQSGDPTPDGNTFSGFGQYVAADGTEVAFSASGSGFNGLFVSGRSGICKVIDTNDSLDGKDITQLSMGRDSYSSGTLGFMAVFSDGSQGIYLAKPPNRFPGGAMILLLDD